MKITDKINSVVFYFNLLECQNFRVICECIENILRGVNVIGFIRVEINK